jgi:hypothetical protein
MHKPQLALAAAALLLCLTLAPRARAASVTYNINATGAAEVTAGGTPNQGDPDGSAVGTVTLDNGTGSGNTGFATLQLTLTNIDLTNLTGNHIHNAPANTTGAIVLDFGDPDTIRTNNILSGTINGLSSATIDNVFANPTNFYYNIHNSTFPGGAVRSQLPEPGALSLLALGGLALLRRGRSRGGL